MAREQAERDAQQAELLVEARVAVFDTKKAELMTQKILAQHSTRMKVALSELVVQTTEDLRSAEIRPKDRALAMVALKTVSERLYGWDREPDIAKMQQAISPLGPAINLALINTRPEELRALGGPNRDSREGVSTKAERNGLSMGPSVEEPEQATAFPPVSQPKQEASSSPVEEPAPSSRTLTQERVAPPIAPRQPVQGSPPCSPAAQERETSSGPGTSTGKTFGSGRNTAKAAIPPFSANSRTSLDRVRWRPLPRTETEGSSAM